MADETPTVVLNSFRIEDERNLKNLKRIEQLEAALMEILEIEIKDNDQSEIVNIARQAMWGTK